MGPQRSYPIRTKREAITQAEFIGERAATKQLETPRRTLRGWMEVEERIVGFEGVQTSKTAMGYDANVFSRLHMT